MMRSERLRRMGGGLYCILVVGGTVIGVHAMMRHAVNPFQHSMRPPPGPGPMVCPDQLFAPVSTMPVAFPDEDIFCDLFGVVPVFEGEYTLDRLFEGIE